jgi:hypothetical protein
MADHRLLHGYYQHITCSWHAVPESERRVVEAVEREREHWRRSVEFWMRLDRLRRWHDEAKGE